MRRRGWVRAATVVLLSLAACGRSATHAGSEVTGPGSPDPSGKAFGTPPRFEDYRVRELFQGTPAAPDGGGNPEAARFGAALAQGARKGPDFAGHYTIVSRSCGRLCREFVIVDAATGRVHPGLSDTPPFEYRLDSRLIAFDAPKPLPGRIPCAGCSAAYYVWENEELSIIPPETWVGSAPPPAGVRAMVDSLRAEERPVLALAGPSVTRPTWDRLVIAARDGSRQVLGDRLEGAGLVVHVLRAVDSAADRLYVDAVLAGEPTRVVERIVIDRRTAERLPR